jgi:hypothetical protein
VGRRHSHPQKEAEGQRALPQQEEEEQGLPSWEGEGVHFREGEEEGLGEKRQLYVREVTQTRGLPYREGEVEGLRYLEVEVEGVRYREEEGERLVKEKSCMSEQRRRQLERKAPFEANTQRHPHTHTQYLSTERGAAPDGVSDRERLDTHTAHLECS